MGFFQWPFRSGLTRLEGLQDLCVAWSRRMRAIRRCSAVAPDSMPATRTIFTFSVFFPPVPCFPELELVVYVCNKVNSNKGAEACITMRQQSVLLGYYRFCYRRLTFPAPFSKYFCFPGFSPPLLLPILKRSQLISVFRTHLHFAGCNSLYSGHMHPADIA